MCKKKRQQKPNFQHASPFEARLAPLLKEPCIHRIRTGTTTGSAFSLGVPDFEGGLDKYLGFCFFLGQKLTRQNHSSQEGGSWVPVLNTWYMAHMYVSLLRGSGYLGYVDTMKKPL